MVKTVQYSKKGNQKDVREETTTYSPDSDTSSNTGNSVISNQSKDHPLLRFKGILNNVKRMTEKERQELLDEFMKDKSDIFRKYNL